MLVNIVILSFRSNGKANKRTSQLKQEDLFEK